MHRLQSFFNLLTITSDSSLLLLPSLFWFIMGKLGVRLREIREQKQMWQSVPMIIKELMGVSMFTCYSDNHNLSIQHFDTLRYSLTIMHKKCQKSNCCQTSEQTKVKVISSNIFHIKVSLGNSICFIPICFYSCQLLS